MASIAEIVQTTDRLPKTPRSPAVSALAPLNGRFLLIDVLRGMLILLMASSHALSLSRVEPGSFWLSGYWLPRGWATDAFIAVSGISAALVYDWKTEHCRAKPSLIRRARQLLVVMFVSNAILLITRTIAIGQSFHLKEKSWWVGLVSGTTAYSISGVLLPTAILLLVLPLINRAVRRMGFAYPFGVTIAALSTMELGIQQGSPVLREVLKFGAGFPVLPMICTGVLGFFVGQAIKRVDLKTDTLLNAGLVAFGLLLIRPVVHWPFADAFVAAGIPLFRILVLACISAILLISPRLQGWRELLGTVGTYSLFCFVGHRFIMHGVLLAGRNLRLPPNTLYLSSMLSTLSILLLLCWFRGIAPSFDHALKRLYL